MPVRPGGIVVRDHFALLESISGIQRSRRLPGLVHPQLDELAALLSQALLNVGYELLPNTLSATSFYHTDLMQKGNSLLAHIHRVGDEIRSTFNCTSRVENPRVGFLPPQIAQAECLIGGECLSLDS